MAGAPMAIKKRTAVALAHTPESVAGQAIAGALVEVASAINAQTAEAKLMREQQRSMHDFFKDASDTMACVRKNTAKWGPWLLGSIPFVISFINGFSPQAAKILQAFVNTLPGVH